MSDFRNTRLGVTNAARLMDVRVTELKQAVRTEQPLHGGSTPLTGVPPAKLTP